MTRYLLAVSISIVSLCSASAQTITDHLMMPKKDFCTGFMYTYDQWKNYWEGSLKRDNQNIGTLTTTQLMWRGVLVVRLQGAVAAVDAAVGALGGERVDAVAAQAGLDLARFERDLDDDALAARIGADYAHGQAEHGVFGTPTFVTPDGDSVYVQVRPAPEPEDAVALLLEVLGIARQRPNVREIKRTKRPAPPEAV